MICADCLIHVLRPKFCSSPTRCSPTCALRSAAIHSIVACARNAYVPPCPDPGPPPYSSRAPRQTFPPTPSRCTPSFRSSCRVALNCKKIHSSGKKLPLTGRIAAFRCHQPLELCRLTRPRSQARMQSVRSGVESRSIREEKTARHSVQRLRATFSRLRARKIALNHWKAAIQSGLHSDG